MARKRKPSRKEIVIRNTSTSLSSVERSSGSLRGTLANAKAKSPFSVAHAPMQQLREYKGVVRTGNTFHNPSVGRFKQGR